MAVARKPPLKPIGDDGDDELDRLLKSGNLDAMIPTDLSGKDKILHNDDALDFESEDELADEEDEETATSPSKDRDDLRRTAGEDDDEEVDELADIFGEVDEDDDQSDKTATHSADLQGAGSAGGSGGGRVKNDPVAAEEARKQLAEEEKRVALRQLQDWYPGFEEHTVLQMNRLFAPEPSQTQLPEPKGMRPLNTTKLRLELVPDQATLFLNDGDLTEPRARGGAAKSVQVVAKDVVRRLNAELGREDDTETTSRDQRSPTRSQHDLEELQIEAANWDDVLDLSDGDVEMAMGDDEGNETSDTSDDGSGSGKRRMSSAADAPASNYGEHPGYGQYIMGLSATSSGSTIEKIHIDSEDIYNSDDEQSILDGVPLQKRTRLDLNDPRLMFVEDRRQQRLAASQAQMASQAGASGASMTAAASNAATGAVNEGDNGVLTASGALLPRTDQFITMNISNDRAYDMLRSNYQRKVRSTIGSLNIDHAMPAVRLQSPFYKVRHTKAQLRSWHRQKFGVKPGTVVHFNPLKLRKRWKDKNRQTQELFAKSSDLTLGDNAPAFLFEHSEETPLVLSGFGMGSKLINYYRKRSDADTHRPKLPLGETHVLEEQDKSTFWNFGFVEPGNVVPTLYNQLTRSPVFQHKTPATDFMLVKSSSHARGVRFFIKPMPYLFTSGQLFPAVQIPGPHSRKVTAASKNRLRMVVYRVLNRDPHQRLQIRDVSNIFPDYNEVQNRQRLKEFMEYQRSGDDQGYWKVKPGDHVPTEAEIRNLITPEDIMLLESMRVGQQQLDDSGYSKLEDDDYDGPAPGKPYNTTSANSDEPMSLEEQLTPWNLSRNFLNAVQGKAMLSLNGDGDPTGRGEGYSFLRTSMKGGFSTEVSAEEEKKLGGHSYNVAMQQRAYDEEIKRIWYAQRRSLSVTDPKRLPDAQQPPRQNILGGNKSGKSGKSGKSANSGASSATAMSSMPTPSAVSADTVLQITRVVRDENDVLVRKTELVTDPLVIRAYLRHRKAAEDKRMAVDQISVTDDAQANKERRKFLETELARLNRNADRRQARKATKQDPKVKATTRKCATCGATGHIKTNKSCPMYNDIYLNAATGKNQAATTK